MAWHAQSYRSAHAVAGLALWVQAASGCNEADDGHATLPSDAGQADAAHASGGHAAAAGGGGAGRAGSSGSSGSAARDAGASSDERDAGEDSVALSLRFRAVIGERTFACGERYANQGSSHVEVTPRDLRFYVQDVRFVNDDGKEVPLAIDERGHWQSKDLALLDFTDGKGECLGSSETNDEITGRAPAGHYHAVRFVVGVPDVLNHGKPETLPEPLQEPGMSWNWLLGFRFLKVEVGASQAVDDADAGAGEGVVHLGSVGCSGNTTAGSVKCSKPNRNAVALEGFDPDKNRVVFDLSALFAGFDLAQDSSCHSADEICRPAFRSLGIDYATGASADTQNAFRVE
jgi:uncharacterized repeat protein (TIGR04052 family)